MLVGRERPDGKSSFRGRSGFFCLEMQKTDNTTGNVESGVWILPVVVLLWADIWKFWLGVTTRVICRVSTRLQLCVCVRACVCHLYITTANAFLAQLNLSKQHTPSWAVKRARRETTERRKNPPGRRVSVETKLPLALWREQEKQREWGTESRWGRGGRARWKSQCVVNRALSFSCHWNPLSKQARRKSI